MSKKRYSLPEANADGKPQKTKIVVSGNRIGKPKPLFIQFGKNKQMKAKGGEPETYFDDMLEVPPTPPTEKTPNQTSRCGSDSKLSEV